MAPALNDQWATRVGKATLWAAGKEPKLSLTLQPTSKELARATLPAAATLQWQGATPGIAADIKFRRGDHGRGQRGQNHRPMGARATGVETEGAVEPDLKGCAYESRQTAAERAKIPKRTECQRNSPRWEALWPEGSLGGRADPSLA